MQRGLALMCIFMLAGLGCQTPAASSGPLESVPTPIAVAVSQQPVAAASESVWGEVPKQCA